MDALLGEHREVVQNMLEKRTPSLAMRSMFGVFSVGWPAQLIAFQRMSSHSTKRTFGRASPVAAAFAVAHAARSEKQTARRRQKLITLSRNLSAFIQEG